MSEQHPPPPPNQYGQSNPYGQPAQAGQADYAHWGKRVAAVLIDGLLMSLAYLPALVGVLIIVGGAETSTVNGTTTIENNDIGPVPILLIVLGGLAYLAFAIWNIIIKQGRTGYTIGKGILGIKLIGEQSGQPIGAGKVFVRQLAHILDGFCYIGYLWPLWDAKKQTFADKIMTTIVINQPKG
jgi:uncharacterized RDD family membrane protein YckC